MILVKVVKVVLAMPQQGDSGAHGDFGACASLWPWSGILSHGEGALVSMALVLLTILWRPESEKAKTFRRARFLLQKLSR